jgi:hypothetical protein
MGGFAGIKTKKNKESIENEEIKKLKRAIYEKIAKNFDIFEFVDDDNPGDDELSDDKEYAEPFEDYGSDRYPSRHNRFLNGGDNMVELLDENHESERLQRKSTMGTAETKSLVKKGTF